MDQPPRVHAAKALHDIIERARLPVSVFRPYRIRLLALSLLSALQTGQRALMAVTLLPLIDDILGLQSSADSAGVWFQVLNAIRAAFGRQNAVPAPFLLLIVLAAINCLTSVSYYYLQYHTLARYEMDKRNDLFSRYLQVDWLYHIDQRAGHAINTMFYDVITSRQWLDQALSLLESALTILFYTLTVALVSPMSVLAMVVLFTVLGIVVLPLRRKVRHYGVEMVQANRALIQHFNEFLTGFKVVKSSRMEDVAQALVGRQTSTLGRLALRTSVLRSLPMAIIKPVVLILLVGIFYLLRNRTAISLSESAVISLLLLQSYQQIIGLHTSWVALSERWASLKSISELPKTLGKHRERRTGVPVDEFCCLEFDHVEFCYRSDKPDRPALSNISLSIRRGEFTGIVGSSGAGKTTLVDLILSLLAPTSGDILVNGIPLQDMDPKRWRDIIGYVPQDPILFHDTVAHNITLLRNEISREDMQWAARIANAHEFICDLPEGYHTLIGDRGVKISGGQRQRLALARALARKPQILLLDEATSSLDTFSERQIQEALEGLRGQITILVVAHRLSTVMGADRIVVLDHGEIVEVGNPHDLAGANGLFQEMYSLQMAPNSD